MYVPVEAGLLIRLRNSAISEPFRTFLALSEGAIIGTVSYIFVYTNVFIN
jgi:hypothetical protein